MLRLRWEPHARLSVLLFLCLILVQRPYSFSLAYSNFRIRATGKHRSDVYNALFLVIHFSLMEEVPFYWCGRHSREEAIGQDLHNKICKELWASALLLQLPHLYKLIISDDFSLSWSQSMCSSTDIFKLETKPIAGRAVPSQLHRWQPLLPPTERHSSLLWRPHDTHPPTAQH